MYLFSCSFSDAEIVPVNSSETTHDQQLAVVTDGAFPTATERQSVQPSSDAKSEGDGDEINGQSARTTSSINSSLPCCPSPPNLQKENKPTEVE